MKDVLGVKLAISDHRAPNVTEDELIQIASKARVAGMLSGKPGMVTLHMGDDKAGLKPVFRALRESSVPVRIFRPTHVNRNDALLEEGYQLLEEGGYVDLTCCMHTTPGDCILEAKKRGLPTEHITISSDGHGSWSNYAEDGTLLEIGVSGVDAIRKEILYMVKTSQVAEGLDLLPKKGVIQPGADADFLLWEADLTLDTFVAGGEIFMKDGKVVKKGTYE
mgnify:CR=1 FL=1